VLPGQPGYQPGQPGQPQPGQLQPGQLPNMPGTNQPPGANPNQIGGGISNQIGGGYPNNAVTSNNQLGNNGPNPTGQQNPALTLINNLLTQPRPQGAPVGTSMPGGTIGAGIAGVASKFEGDSIKVYNEREKYDEWEFVYDMKKDKRLTGANPGGVPPTNGPNVNPGNGPLNNGGNINPGQRGRGPF
jgi:hypothetical protein